ncbi:MAG: hypothetical protein MZV49_12095 [Rhodopseudomonas palustris]|nr:hypothetical protein [Rhodopseudomonas palustris]
MGRRGADRRQEVDEGVVVAVVARDVAGEDRCAMLANDIGSQDDFLLPAPRLSRDQPGNAQQRPWRSPAGSRRTG